MKRKTIQIFLLSLFIIFLSSFLFNIFFKKNEQNTVQVDFLKDGIDIKINNAYVVSDHNNTKEWELSSKTARISKKDATTYLDDMKMKFYTSDAQMINITANKGQVANDKKKIEMSGDVVITNKDYTLNTQRLKWMSSKEEITTDLPVHLEGKRFKISGKGLFINTKSNMIKINNNVKATFDLG